MAINAGGAKVGDTINVVVKAVFGETNDTTQDVIYQESPAATATFKCTGTTLDFKCALYSLNTIET